MADFYEWNQAIYRYVTDGLPMGARVFLSIDEEALIGASHFLDSVPSTPECVDDFLQAVRVRYITGNRIQHIRPIGNEYDKVPRYLSFLAATVLAAYKMEEDEDVSSTNYFRRLNQILGFSNRQRRPRGMMSGIEDKLWRHWANWLIHKGYLPSAKGGEGSYRYINYPISQTLLRKADRKSLRGHFAERNWPKNLDEDTVTIRVLRDRHYLIRHLTRLLGDQEMSPIRREGLYQAIYNVYDLWANHEPEFRDQAYFATPKVRNVSAGLYRTVDYIYNEPEYAIFPRRPQQLRNEQATIAHDGQTYTLIPEYPRWYRPLWDVSAQHLDSGLEVAIKNVEGLNKLIFQTSDFWILTPEPDDPDSGIHASWGKPDIGTPFIILCKETLNQQLAQLRIAGLIDWHDQPFRVWEDDVWLEYRDVMVISSNWEGIHLGNSELTERLQPKTSLGISFRGGIRAQHKQGWFVEYGPEVTIHSVYREADLMLFDPISEEQILKETLETNGPIEINWPNQAGSYILQVNAGDHSAPEGSIVFVQWKSIQPALVKDYPKVDVGTNSISGALVEIAGL